MSAATVDLETQRSVLVMRNAGFRIGFIAYGYCEPLGAIDMIAA